MKEIVIRKNIYDASKQHKLVETDVNGEYKFVPFADWCPLYLNYDNQTIVSFDSEGFGSPICIGDAIGGKCVKKIYFKDNVGLIVVLENAD